MPTEWTRNSTHSASLPVNYFSLSCFNLAFLNEKKIAVIKSCFNQSILSGNKEGNKNHLIKYRTFIEVTVLEIVYRIRVKPGSALSIKNWELISNFYFVRTGQPLSFLLSNLVKKHFPLFILHHRIVASGKANKIAAFLIERFSIKCRKTKIKVITMANQKKGIKPLRANENST